MLSEKDQRAANDLAEVIADELHGETVPIQIRVLFTVMAAVLTDCIYRDPDQSRDALSEIRRLFSVLQ